jgi:hypothetical protein
MSETDAEFIEIMMEQGDWGPGSRMHRLALLARRGAEAAAEIERLRSTLQRLRRNATPMMRGWIDAALEEST